MKTGNIHSIKKDRKVFEQSQKWLQLGLRREICRVLIHKKPSREKSYYRKNHTTSPCRAISRSITGCCFAFFGTWKYFSGVESWCKQQLIKTSILRFWEPFWELFTVFMKLTTLHFVRISQEQSFSTALTSEAFSSLFAFELQLWGTTIYYNGRHFKIGSIIFLPGDDIQSKSDEDQNVSASDSLEISDSILLMFRSSKKFDGGCFSLSPHLPPTSTSFLLLLLAASNILFTQIITPSKLSKMFCCECSYWIV